MATPQLKRHQAVIWLPPRSAGERAFGSEALLLAHMGGEPRVRRASLDSMENIRQAWLIADARDVSLLDVTVPPLSGSRLRQALPNVVEEFLLQDVAKCLVVPGPATSEGKRLVGVIDRDWVEFVVGAFARRQVRVDALWPAQLALPLAVDQWSLSCAHGALALRTGPVSGIGWSAGEAPEFRAEAIESVLEAGAATTGVAKPPKLRAFLESGDWQKPVQKAAQRAGMVVEMSRLPLVRTAPIDLLLGRASGMKAAMAQFDWRVWRAPAGLAAACVIAALVGLNLHWALQGSQKQALRSAIEQKFRAAFPGTQAVIDPVLQMKRNVAALRAQSGRAGPDDFVPLVSRLAQALGPKGLDAIAALEYREGEIKVRFNPAAATGKSSRDALRQACARLGMKLTFDNERDLTAKLTVQGA
jgi:general secretion pathway protein L